MAHSPIYYVILADKNSRKEIGAYIDDTALSDEDKKAISLKKEEIINNVSIEKNKRVKVDFNTSTMYYTLSQSTLYIVVIEKEVKYEEAMIYEMIEDIDNKGIKKLINEQGKLTNVAKQNLKYTIDTYFSVESEEETKEEEKNDKKEEPKEEIKIDIKNGLQLNDSDFEVKDKQSLEISDSKAQSKEEQRVKLRKKMCCYKTLIFLVVIFITGFSLFLFYLKP